MNGSLRQKLFVFFIPLVLALPFLNRAYFVDDHYFVEIATWLKDNPLKPYDFTADDAGLQNHGWEKDGFVRMVNPLAHQYYLALLLKIGGEREWFLRLGCVLLSCFSALFVFLLAQRLTRHAFLATLLVLVTPVFWLTSYSLLIDATMAFFAFGGLYFFVRVTEYPLAPPPWALLILSGVFIGFAILSKYPAISVLPLSAAWLVLNWKRPVQRARFLLPWIVALAMLIAYSVWTKELYGAPHIFAASKRMVNTFGWAKFLIFFVFFSGSFVLPLAAWAFVSKRARLAAGAAVVLLAWIFSTPWGGFALTQAALLSVWFVTSFVFIGAVLRDRARWRAHGDLFLLVWILGFVGMMLLVMNWVAARYYLLVAPAVVFALARMIENRWPEKTAPALQALIAVTFLFTAALGYADYQQAEPSRRVGAILKEKGFAGGERHFYLGDSFTMSYLRDDGWVPAFPQTEFKVGDWVLAKRVTMPLVWFARKPIRVRELAAFDFPTKFPVKVMDADGSAGFYASVWGALPFTFSRGPWERFTLLEVTEVTAP